MEKKQNSSISSGSTSLQLLAKRSLLWDLLDELAGKKGINEVTINNHHSIFVEKEGRFFLLDFKVSIKDVFEFVKEVAEYNKKDCNEQSPILDGSLPDGSRINIIHPPYVRVTPVITIRKYLNEITTFDSSPGIFSLSANWIQFLRALVKARVNILVSGGTGVGKTTLMNLLLQEIPRDERVITIEDTRELNFKIPNLINLETGQKSITYPNPLTMRDLVKNSLRMRPDRLIVGEVRGGEIFDLLQAMNTGHDGSMTSIHANTPSDCVRRISTLYLLAGYEVPLKAIRGQIASAINFILQLGRNREGKRTVTEISEITGMEGDNILMQKIGQLGGNGELESTAIVPHCIKRLVEKGGLIRDIFNSKF